MGAHFYGGWLARFHRRLSLYLYAAQPGVAWAVVAGGLCMFVTGCAPNPLTLLMSYS